MRERAIWGQSSWTGVRLIAADDPVLCLRDWRNEHDFVGQHALRSEADAEVATLRSAAQEPVHGNWDGGRLPEEPALSM